MPSPFPGMDPFIEKPELWSDFHSDLASEIRGRLNQRFQPRYVARLTRDVTYEVIEIAAAHGIRPDVGMWQPQLPAGELAVDTLSITPAPVENQQPPPSPPLT